MHANPGRTVTTNVAMDAFTKIFAQQQQSIWQHSPLAAELPGASPMSQFGQGLEGGQPGSQAANLQALNFLIDLPLYDTMASRTAAPPSTSHCDDPFLQPQPAVSTRQPARDGGFRNTTLLPSSMPGQQQQPRLDPSVQLFFPAPALQPLTCHPPPTAILGESTSSSSQLQSPHLPSSSPLPFDVQSLLDDPLTASLITTQLGKRRPRSAPHPPSPPARAPPIAKPKRKKIRPRDRIQTLEQHLGEVTNKIHHLTLCNHRIQRKKHVLGIFVQELARMEDIAAEVQASIQQHKANPAAAPPDSPAALQSWTTARLREAYMQVVSRSSQWILKVEEAGGTPSPAELAELEGAIHEFLRVSVYSSCGRVDFMGRFMAEQLQMYSGAVPEEEHWNNVLEAMELTEEQVEDLLVAREVYLQYSDTVAREHSSAVATLQQRSRQATATSGAMDGLQDKDQINKLATTIRKIHTLNIILVLFWFQHTATPVQTARALMHAYPLIPGGMLMGNTLHALRGQAPSRPLLGPPPSPMASVRTVAALQRMTGAPPPIAPPAPSSAPSSSHGSGSGSQ